MRRCVPWVPLVVVLLLLEASCLSPSSWTRHGARWVPSRARVPPQTAWPLAPTIAAASASESDQLPKRKGKAHSERSKARISEANKGNVPWNKGGRHSEETRKKIAETLRRRAIEAKEKKARALGLTLEEMIARETEVKESKQAQNRTPSQATRAKISAAMKRRWEDPMYRENMSAVARGRERVVSEATRRKISESLKEKWRTDDSYRQKIQAYAANSSKETREKISKTLKERWTDPEFRARMKSRQMGGTMTEEHRQKISEAVKAKWRDPDYRQKTIKGIQSQSQSRSQALKKQPSRKSTRKPQLGKSPPKNGVTERQDRVVRKPASKLKVAAADLPSAPEDPTSGNRAPPAARRNPVQQEGLKEGEENKTSQPRRKQKVPPPAPASEDEQHSPDLEGLTRIERLRITDPDLWQALYADDDELALGPSSVSKPPPTTTGR